MPHHPNILSRPFLVCVLALTMQLCGQARVAAAGECLTKPQSRADILGRWYFHVDRVRHRKCWFIEPTPPAAALEPAPQPQSAPTANQSLLSWLAAGLQETFSAGTPQSNSPDEPPATANKVFSKHSNMRARLPKHRSHVASRHEKKGPVGAAVRLSPTRRNALFEEFQQFLKLRETDGSGGVGR